MKATLTFIYEREVDEDSQSFLDEAVMDKDVQAIMEFFEIGWDSPVQSTITFDEIPATP
jgi:hypothetical protein